MDKSISELTTLLAALRRRARELGFNDREWASRAGVSQETLSRLRHRQSCDLATLQALASVVGSAVGLIDAPEIAATDRRFPDTLDRDYEERLVTLCAAAELEAARWRRLGPPFFMAGLAVMLASTPEFDRPALLRLAEELHAGSTQVDVFKIWLQGSPVRPSRFLPMVSARARHAA